MFGSLFHSFVIAQIFGLYLLIMALVFLARVKHYKAVVEAMQPLDSAIFVSASSSLMLGLFLVIVHNIWVLQPRLLVTILCWLVLIKAVLWLAIPDHMLAWTKRTCAGNGYYISAFVMAFIGILMLTKGFYLFI